MAKLTALKIKRVGYPPGRKGPFLISDGNGLSLQIMPSGSKSWIFRFRLGGKSHYMGLGGYSEEAGGVSLAEARELVAAARSLVRQNIDPREARTAAKVARDHEKAAAIARTKTFEDAARDYIEVKRDGWRNVKHAGQWSATLDKYVYPVLGRKVVSEIDADAVEAVLKPIWLELPETASRIRGRIENILDFAKSKGWRNGENPAVWKDGLKHRLPAISRRQITEHHPALPWQKVPEFVAALGMHDGVSAKALLFCILNANRSGEVRGATWREIDLDKGIWTIPASRMKMQREHKIPLSKAAVAVLKLVQIFNRGPDSVVFPNRKGNPLSDMALSEIVRGMNDLGDGQSKPWLSHDGRPIVVHGFRSTFRDWCEEATSTPQAVSEAALSHPVADKVEAAYRRTDLFERRKGLMQLWGEHCMSICEFNSLG